MDDTLKQLRSKCDIEITADVDEPGMQWLNSFKLNGQEILLPADTGVHITAAMRSEPTKVTVTMYATSISIKAPEQ